VSHAKDAVSTQKPHGTHDTCMRSTKPVTRVWDCCIGCPSRRDFMASSIAHSTHW
jgi:hypothetical protein